ncbi:MAG: hypothetical protein KF705_12835 [Phycisphaeraceae bacterium]|nr:hypothetical protein [Phycisphaeraceae bacterium]
MNRVVAGVDAVDPLRETGGEEPGIPSAMMAITIETTIENHGCWKSVFTAVKPAMNEIAAYDREPERDDTEKRHDDAEHEAARGVSQQLTQPHDLDRNNREHAWREIEDESPASRGRQHRRRGHAEVSTVNSRPKTMNLAPSGSQWSRSL